MIIVLPAPAAVTTPFETVATLELAELHVTVALDGTVAAFRVNVLPLLTVIECVFKRIPPFTPSGVIT